MTKTRPMMIPWAEATRFSFTSGFASSSRPRWGVLSPYAKDMPANESGQLRYGDKTGQGADRMRGGRRVRGALSSRQWVEVGPNG